MADNADAVVAILAKEEQAFRRSLRKGIKQLNGYRRSGVTGAELFVLYDTFGFPVELSTEEARRKDIALSNRTELARQGAALKQSLGAAQTAERLYEVRYTSGSVALRVWLDAQQSARAAHA